MQRAMFFAVWDSSTAMSAGSEPKDDSWETSKVQQREAATAAVMAKAMLRME